MKKQVKKTKPVGVRFSLEIIEAFAGKTPQQILNFLETNYLNNRATAITMGNQFETPAEEQVKQDNPLKNLSPIVPGKAIDRPDPKPKDLEIAKLQAERKVLLEKITEKTPKSEIFRIQKEVDFITNKIKQLKSKA